jgi:hypothetical protein
MSYQPALTEVSSLCSQPDWNAFLTQVNTGRQADECHIVFVRLHLTEPTGRRILDD